MQRHHEHATASAPSLLPPAFLVRGGGALTGVLSGFDRLRLRGTLRHLFQPTAMEAYRNACRVLIERLRAVRQVAAQAAGGAAAREDVDSGPSG